MPPVVEFLLHLYIIASAFYKNYILNTRGMYYCFINLFLKVNDLTPPVTAISRNYQTCLRVIDTIFKCLCTEPPKDHTMNCTYPCACQHCYGQLRDHWHVNGYPVTFSNAK